MNVNKERMNDCMSAIGLHHPPLAWELHPWCMGVFVMWCIRWGL